MSIKSIENKVSIAIEKDRAFHSRLMYLNLLGLTKMVSDYEKLPAIHQIAWRQIVIETLFQKDLTGETSWNTYINWIEATSYASNWNNLSPQYKTAWAHVANYICKE